MRLVVSPTDLHAKLLAEIDSIDTEILRLVEYRTQLEREQQRLHVAAGGTRIVHSRDIEVLGHFGRLGADGRDLAMTLIRLGRSFERRDNQQ